jgi:hypothetical protein
MNELRDAIHAEILTERTLRYKRNAMVIALVTAAVHLAPIDFSNLNLLGAKIGNGANQRALTLGVLWVTLLYNAGWAIYLIWRDWRRWISNITDEQWPPRGTLPTEYPFFPELRMYWSGMPTDATAQRRRSYAIAETKFVRWLKPKIDKMNGVMEFSYLVRGGPERAEREVSGFKVPLALVTEVKETYQVFRCFEVGPAALCVALAAAGLAWEGWPLVALLLPK